MSIFELSRPDACRDGVVVRSRDSLHGVAPVLTLPEPPFQAA